MKLKKVTYKKLVSVFMPILLVLPMLIANVHILVHCEEHDEHHAHNNIAFCDDEISFCEYSDYIFYFPTNVVKTSYKTPNIIYKEVDINAVENKYFNLFSRYKKGRSPPVIA